MPRWPIAIALFWATWAVQQPGVAHARSSLISEFGPAMCSEGSQAVLLDDSAFGRALLLLSAAPASHATPAAQASAELLVDEDEAPPAWCVSPDDPRCSPRDQGAPLESPRVHTPLQYASALDLPELAFGRKVVTLRPVQLGAARAGVGSGLERPPQQS